MADDSSSSSSSSAVTPSYIHKVHHMIETCLVFNMNKEECVEALSKHANINPVITSTVWKALERENKEFFKAYEERQKKEEQMSVVEKIKQMLEKIISDSFKESDD